MLFFFFLQLSSDDVIHVCVAFSDPEQLVIRWDAGWKCKNTPDAPAVQNLLREGRSTISFCIFLCVFFSPSPPFFDHPDYWCSRTRRSTAGQSRSPSKPWSPGSGTSIKPERKRSPTRRKQPRGRSHKLLRYKSSQTKATNRKWWHHHQCSVCLKITVCHRPPTTPAMATVHSP